MNRLRAFREIEGLSQQELAERLGISAQMVSAIESGRRPVSPGVLQALGYDEDRLVLPDMSEPLHRHRASTAIAAKKRAHELVRLGGEVFGPLQVRTERAPKTAIEIVEPPASLDDIEDLATDARYMLRHELTGPIQNLTSVVERAGVCIVPLVGLPGIDGLSAWVDGVPVVGLSPHVPGDRFRLTLAHELAHLMMHRRSSDVSESEANRFAAALLFPREEFEAAMPERPQLRDFVSLKGTWGVSVAALVYRAHELDFIDDARYRSLQIQMSKWRRSEPGEFDPARGTLLGRLVDVNGGVEAVGRELGLNRAHVATVVNWNHLRVA